MRRLAIPLIAGFLAAVPAQAAQLSMVMEAVRADKWDEAARLARRGDKVMRDIVDWRRLRAGEGTYAEYRDFLSRHPHWPGLDRIRVEADRALTPFTDPEEVLDLYSAAPPLTGTGAVRLVAAFRALGRREEAEALAVDTWLNKPLTEAAQAELLTLHGPILAPYNTQRLDMLLWRGAETSAQQMLPLVSEGWRKLAEARIALRARRNGVDAKINAVPAELRGDPGLAFERFDWRAANGLGDSAVELLLERSDTAADLGKPEAWAQRRAIFARSLMRDGQHARAYQIASSHHLSEGSAFTDLEWVSGYLALRFLKLTIFHKYATYYSESKKKRITCKNTRHLGNSIYWTSYPFSE